MKEFIKEAAREIVPPFIWNVGKSINARRRKKKALADPVRQRLETDFVSANKGLPPDTMVIRPGMKVRLHPDCRASYEYFCFLSHDSVLELDGFIEATKDKKCLLDIGALHGIFSVAFASQHPERKALAVDASPLAFARLLYNLHKNNLTNVTPIECALSDQVGELAMHYEWEHLVAQRDGQKGNPLKIAMKTGDQLCAENHFEPDAIKIDVEGHEIKVIKGLETNIRKHRPVIFLEVHPFRIAMEKDDPDFLGRFFGELGYTAKTVAGIDFPMSGFRTLSQDDRLILTPIKATA